MKAILRNTMTNKLVVELMDDLSEELTEYEVSELFDELGFGEEELENLYISYE